MLDTIKGELKIFTREVETKSGDKRILFNACVGYSKTEDGEYINAYVPVAFSKSIKKDVPYKEESFDVVVKEAFFTAYKDKDDIARLKLFINKAKFVSVDEEEEDEDEEEEKPKKKAQSKKPQSKKATSKKSKSDEDDLPF